MRGKSKECQRCSRGLAARPRGLADEFLRDRSRKLFEWETHVTLTASSARAMVEAEADEARRASLKTTADVTDAARLRPRMTSTAAAAVDAWAAEYGPADELKVTVLVTWDGDATTVGCHVAPLPPLPAPPVRVEVRGAPRALRRQRTRAGLRSAAARGADARQQRRRRQRAAPRLRRRRDPRGLADEFLRDRAGGRWQAASHPAAPPATACSRGRCAACCSRCASARASRWCSRRRSSPTPRAGEGAMISSTSRLLLPVDELYVPQPGACAEETDRVRRFGNGDGSLAARLRALVAEEVEAHSSALREAAAVLREGVLGPTAGLSRALNGSLQTRRHFVADVVAVSYLQNGCASSHGGWMNSSGESMPAALPAQRASHSSMAKVDPTTLVGRRSMPSARLRYRSASRAQRRQHGCALSATTSTSRRGMTIRIFPHTAVARPSTRYPHSSGTATPPAGRRIGGTFSAEHRRRESPPRCLLRPCVGGSQAAGWETRMVAPQKT